MRGPIVMKGYWRKPELTAQTLRGGWMHTGDSGYFDDDGFLFIADRIKDMIISGGENVYSIEVENAIRSILTSLNAPSSAFPIRAGAKPCTRSSSRAPAPTASHQKRSSRIADP